MLRLIRGIFQTTLLLGLLLLLSTGPVLSAQETAKLPNILVTSRGFAGPDVQRTLDGFNRSVAGELQRNGMNAVIIEEDTDLRQLLETAGSLGAFFLVESRYAADSSSFQLNLVAYSTWDGATIAARRIAADLGTESDLFWENELSGIILTIQTYLKIIEEENLTTESDFAELSVREVSIPLVGDAGNTADISGGPDAIPADSVRGDGAGLPGDIHTVSGVPPEVFQPISLGLGGAPLLAVGTASEVFKIGGAVTLDGGYSWRTDYGSFRIGLVVDFAFFHADGILVSSENQLLSVGPGIGITLGTGGPFHLLLGVSAGLTLTFVQVENGIRETVTSAGLSARLGGRFDFNSRWGISLTNRFAAYFLPDAPIVGVLPTLMLHTSF